MTSDEGPRAALPYIAALALILLIVLIAWYLFGRNQHVISLLLPMLSLPAITDLVA